MVESLVKLFKHNCSNSKAKVIAAGLLKLYKPCPLIVLSTFHTNFSTLLIKILLARPSVSWPFHPVDLLIALLQIIFSFLALRSNLVRIRSILFCCIYFTVSLFSFCDAIENIFTKTCSLSSIYLKPLTPLDHKQENTKQMIMSAGPFPLSEHFCQCFAASKAKFYTLYDRFTHTKNWF